VRAWRDDPIVARAAPFLLFIGFLILESVAPLTHVVQETGLRMPWLVVARAAVVGLLLVWFWRGYTELHRPMSVRPVDWALAVTGGIVVFFAWIAIDQDWAVLSRSSGFLPLRADGSVDLALALARLAGFALVVPVMEELFWRSLVLRWIERHDFQSLAPREVGWRAFAITAALFAVEHDRWFAGALAGGVYGLLYMRSGNLWVPVVAHVVTNGILGLWVLWTGRWEFW
jgi:CAAX prenyl protease-like protein